MPFPVPEDLIPLAPVLVTAVTVLLLMLNDLVVPRPDKKWLAALALTGVVAAGYTGYRLWGLNSSGFRNSVVADNYGLFLSFVVLVAGSLGILLSVEFVAARGLEPGEFLALLVAAVTGMTLLVLANDLIIIFLALEILSLSLYLLSAFWKGNGPSLEAGVKYFILGAFSSAFFLYGVAFVFGATGTTNLSSMQSAVAQHGASTNSLLLIGVGLLLTGFGFKVALVPFQWWTPDVYEGAPTPVTAFMSVATKTAAFAALFRVFLVAFPITTWDWRLLFSALAVLTMTVGNLAALMQSGLKRMLAYSSIAHAGYILIALVAGGNDGTSAALFYLLAYTMMNLGAFGVLIAFGEKEGERLTLSNLAGLSADRPLLAAGLAICLLSLAGFPPFGGFVGKFFVFSAAVAHGWSWLAILGVVNSLVSVYFYLGPVIRMYMSASEDARTTSTVPRLVGMAVAIAVLATIFLGIAPAGALALAQASALR